MRFISYTNAQGPGVALRSPEGYRGLPIAQLGGDLRALLAEGGQGLIRAAKRLIDAPVLASDGWTLLPLIPDPEKIICIGLNYADHSAESGFEVPAYPTVFARYATSLV